MDNKTTGAEKDRNDELSFVNGVVAHGFFVIAVKPNEKTTV